MLRKFYYANVPSCKHIIEKDVFYTLIKFRIAEIIMFKLFRVETRRSRFYLIERKRVTQVAYLIIYIWNAAPGLHHNTLATLL